jgi:hypothetical protein
MFRARLDGMPSAARLALCMLSGFLYGLIVSRIPAPSDPTVLPAGYFVAPWLVLPFLAGRLQHSVPWAAAAGALTEVLCIFGFYLNAFPQYDPAFITLKETTSGIALVLGSAVLWVTVNAMWYGIATVTGIAFGLLGRWWASGSSTPVAILGAFFILEPLTHLFSTGLVPQPYLVWVFEEAAGLALPVWALVVRKRRVAGPA